MEDDHLPEYPVAAEARAPEPLAPTQARRVATADRGPGAMGRAFRGSNAEDPWDRLTPEARARHRRGLAVAIYACLLLPFVALGLALTLGADERTVVIVTVSTALVWLMMAVRFGMEIHQHRD